MTLLEKKTQNYLAIRISSKTSEAVNAAIAALREEYGERFSQVFRTITVDNGSEFAEFSAVEQWGTKVYFAHPCTSWKRPHNERHNGMLRNYIPKGISIELFSDEDILAASDIIKSTLFSFTLSKISNHLACKLSDTTLLEKCYTAFSLISPINSKYTQTKPILNKLKPFLKELSNGKVDSIPEFFPEFLGIPTSETLGMFLTMHIFSDVRRCVISILIENNSWFKSICTHKRKETQVF